MFNGTEYGELGKELPEEPCVEEGLVFLPLND
jgi:hypothetical protein